MIAPAALTLLLLGEAGAVLPPSLPHSPATKPLLVEAERRMRSGETNKALRILDEAVADEPGNALAFELRAEVLLWLGRHRLAAADVARALELAPGPASWRAQRIEASAASALSGYRTLLQEAGDAARRDPKDARARYRQAWAHAGLGQNEEALAALRAAASIETSFSRSYLRAVELGTNADLIGIFSATAKAAYPPPPPPRPR